MHCEFGLHCEFDEANINFLIFLSVAGLKFCKVGEAGLVKGSVIGENLILMRSILSLKKSRNAMHFSTFSKIKWNASEFARGGIVWKFIRWIPMETMEY